MLTTKTVHYCTICDIPHPVCSLCKEIIRDDQYIETDGTYLDVVCAKSLGVIS